MEHFEYQDLLNRLQETDGLSRYFRFLHETTLELINNLELNDLLKAIINRAAELVNTTHAYVYLLDPGATHMTLTQGIGLFQGIRFTLQRGEGLVGRVWDTSQTMLVNKYCEWEGRVTHRPFHEIRAALGVPLVAESQVIGVLGLVYLEDDRYFYETELNMVGQFAELASLALANAKLYERAKNELLVRKKMEKSLRRTEATHRALLDAIPDTLLRINRERNLLSCKVGSNPFLNGPIKDHIGGKLESIFPEEVIPFFYQAITTVFDSGKMQEFECQTKSQEGLHDWEVRVVAGGDDEAMIILRDITERKQAEAKVQEAKRALAGIEKLISLATISGGIAHEINQPLTSIKFAADSMLFWLSHDQKIEQEELFDYIKDISAQASRIDNIVSQICSIQKEQNLTGFAPCNLNGAVEAALRRLSPQLRLQGINVKKNLARKLTLVRGNLMILDQVIGNLLTNSIQALGKKDKSDREIFITTRVKDKVILEIQDNGLGIETDALDKIFDPFFTTKTYQENIGLGLFFAYGIITAYGGQLSAFNHKGGGATFQIEFPLIDTTERKGGT